MATTNTSCYHLAQAVIDCIHGSPCMRKSGHTFEYCLEHGFSKSHGFEFQCRRAVIALQKCKLEERRGGMFEQYYDEDREAIDFEFDRVTLGKNRYAKIVEEKEAEFQRQEELRKQASQEAQQPPPQPQMNRSNEPYLVKINSRRN